MINEDEYLERIVAGIHAVTTADAEVSWNEVLNGRQFDVVVRFSLGTLRYLVLVEVKNRTRKASAEDLDAFVSKARDQIANKAVFVTAAGFQSGALAIAQRHGIDLFTVTFDETEVQLANAGFLMVRKPGVTIAPGVVPTISIGDPELILNLDAITLRYTDRREYELPDEQSQMTYYMVQTKTDEGTSLAALIDTHRFGPVELDKSRREKIILRPPPHVTPPDDYYFPAGKLKAIECLVTGRLGRGLSGTARIDPGAFRHPVIYTNVLTGASDRFSLDQLPLGVGEVVPGSFYFLPHPIRYYHCDSVSGGLVTWSLIESFQSGQKTSGTYTQSMEFGAHYIPVTDKVILRRLARRHADYLALTGKALPPVAAPPPFRRRGWYLPWKSGRA